MPSQASVFTFPELPCKMCNTNVATKAWQKSLQHNWVTSNDSSWMDVRFVFWNQVFRELSEPGCCSAPQLPRCYGSSGIWRGMEEDGEKRRRTGSAAGNAQIFKSCWSLWAHAWLYCVAPLRGRPSPFKPRNRRPYPERPCGQFLASHPPLQLHPEGLNSRQTSTFDALNPSLQGRCGTPRCPLCQRRRCGPENVRRSHSL